MFSMSNEELSPADDAEVTAETGAGADEQPQNDGQADFGGGDAPEAEPAPSGPILHRVTVTEAGGNPIIIYVNGREEAELRIGVETEITGAALEALAQVDGAVFTVAEQEDATDE